MTPSAAELLTLRVLPLFDAAKPDTWAMLLAGSGFEEVPRGASLVCEGDAETDLHVLVDGTVELESRWAGRESTLALLRPLSIFGLASVVLGVSALTNARALTRARLLRIPGENLRRAMRADGDFAIAVAEELAGCYCGVVRTLKSYKLRSAVERLANYLLSQHKQQGGRPAIRLDCQKRVLASLLGMTPENLSRAFATLAEHGVAVNGATILLERPDALIALAQPDPLIDNHSVSDTKLGRAAWERRRAMTDVVL